MLGLFEVVPPSCRFCQNPPFWTTVSGDRYLHAQPLQPTAWHMQPNRQFKRIFRAENKELRSTDINLFVLHTHYILQLFQHHRLSLHAAGQYPDATHLNTTSFLSTCKRQCKKNPCLVSLHLQLSMICFVRTQKLTQQLSKCRCLNYNLRCSPLRI